MRTKNSIFNFLTSAFPFIIFVIAGFVRVCVWQANMDENIYALNQLFFQLFAYLSIAEAGIGALVQKKYYGLIVDNDREEICKYYTLSKRMLRNVCYFIIGAGFILSFFLKFLANGNTLSLFYMQAIFLLFLAKSLVEYFMFAPRFLLTADQKLYKMNLQSYGYKIAESIMEIVLIYIGISYILVLCLSIVLRIIMNLHLNRIVFKEYPWLKDAKDTSGCSLKGTKHILIFKVVSAVQENVDTLIISAFIDPISVIIYSNYKYITKYLSDFIYQVGVAVTASLGNLLNESRDEKALGTFEMVNSMFFFIATFLSLTLAFCINPFISIWVGADKLLDTLSVLCLLFVFFHKIAQRPLYVLKDVFLLYKETQLYSIIEAICTVVFSLIFIKLGFGIKSVIYSSALSLLLNSFIYMPLVVYKNIFQSKPVKVFVEYLISLTLILGLYALGSRLPFAVSSSSFVMWFLTSCVAAVIILTVLTAIYYCLFKSFRQFLKTGFSTFLAIIKPKKA